MMTNLRALAPAIPLFPVGCLGHDDHAAKVLDHCRRLAVPTDHLIRLEGETTGHTHVMNVPGKSRTFFYAGGANDVFSDHHVPVEDLAGAAIFYLGYVMLLEALDDPRNDGTTAVADLLERARSAGMTACVDLVSATRDDYAAVVGASLPHIDFLMFNELELSRSSGCEVSADAGPQNRAAMAQAEQRLIYGVCAVRLSSTRRRPTFGCRPTGPRPGVMPSRRARSSVRSARAMVSSPVYSTVCMRAGRQNAASPSPIASAVRPLLHRRPRRRLPRWPTSFDSPVSRKRRYFRGNAPEPGAVIRRYGEAWTNKVDSIRPLAAMLTGGSEKRRAIISLRMAAWSMSRRVMRLRPTSMTSAEHFSPPRKLASSFCPSAKPGWCRADLEGELVHAHAANGAGPVDAWSGQGSRRIHREGLVVDFGPWQLDANGHGNKGVDHDHDAPGDAETVVLAIGLQQRARSPFR